MSTQIIPPRQDFIDPRTGKISREWYLFLLGLLDAVGGAGSNTTLADLALEQAFEISNTSEIAELQAEIDALGSNDGLDTAFSTTGTVRYVNATAPTGVLGVTGVPYQEDGAITFAWSGTSGGIPYFSASTSMASSAALTANAIILGGGAGTTPASLGSLGTTTTLLHGNAAGAPTFGAVVLTADVSGLLPIANIDPGVFGFAARHG